MWFKLGDIIERYHQRICDMYMASHPNVNRDRVIQLINDVTEKHFRDLPCQLHNNVTHTRINTSIKNVIDWIECKQPIISGAGSFFKQHEEYLSPSTLMLESLMDDRGAVKNEMWKFDKESIEYMNLNTEQSSIKVIMNADYGGSGTPLSPFYSQYIPPATTGTAKNITTTLICCLEYSSDNQDEFAKLQNINELYDMIRIVLTNEEEREYIDDVYQPEEVLERLCSRVVNITLSDRRVLLEYLSTLEPFDLSRLMLAFNIRLVCKKYLHREIGVVAQYAKSHLLDPENMNEQTIHAAGYGKKAPDEIKPYIDRINKIILDNCIYPFIPNDAESRATKMTRCVVCVTDTDSLMVHFASFIDEFQAKADNSEWVDSNLFASVLGVRLFVEAIIPKFTEYVAIGMNIKDKKYRDKFIFKNEFGFLAMALSAKKMYAASMFVQEGVPRKIHNIAVTGLSFKKRDAPEFLEPIMEDLYDRYILTSKTVDVSGLLDEYYALRRKLKDEVEYNTGYYQVLSVKAEEAYDPKKKLPDQIRGSKAWNAMFPEDTILPMDRVIIVPLSKDKLEEHSSNQKVSELLRFCKLNDDPKWDPVFCLPEWYKEIPDWLRGCIDVDRLVDKLTASFKQQLGLFGVVIPETKGGCIASRMVYI